MDGTKVHMFGGIAKLLSGRCGLRLVCSVEWKIMWKRLVSATWTDGALSKAPPRNEFCLTLNLKYPCVLFRSRNTLPFKLCVLCYGLGLQEHGNRRITAPHFPVGGLRAGAAQPPHYLPAGEAFPNVEKAFPTTELLPRQISCLPPMSMRNARRTLRVCLLYPSALMPLPEKRGDTDFLSGFKVFLNSAGVLSRPASA